MRHDKNNVQSLFTAGNFCPAWEGAKTIGMEPRRKAVVPRGVVADSDFSNEFNTFYNCFNGLDFRHELSAFMDAVPVHKNNMQRRTVLRQLKGVKQRKSPGPGGIGGRSSKPMDSN